MARFRLPVLYKIIKAYRGLVLCLDLWFWQIYNFSCIYQLHVRNTAKHILTIEDPIEFIFKHTENSIIHQREVEDTNSFSVALRAALREDPM